MSMPMSILSTMEIHFTLHCLLPPEAINHRMQHKIKTLSKEHSHQMELLRDSCTPDEFSFYSTKLDSMCQKDRSHPPYYDNNNTDNSLVKPQVNSITNNNDTSSYVTHNIFSSTQSSNATPTHKRSRRKTKPTNSQLDNSSVANLSSYSQRNINSCTWTYIPPHTSTSKLVGSFSWHLPFFSMHATY